jgi:hypothetical protein
MTARQRRVPTELETEVGRDGASGFWVSRMRMMP